MWKPPTVASSPAIFTAISPAAEIEINIRQAVRRSVFSQTLVTMGTVTAIVTTSTPITMAMPSL